MDPESALVGQARKGSREAFAQIVRLHQAPVRAFLSKYVQQDDGVDDLAQETFLAAYRSLATYRADAPVRTWLLGIARHRVLQYLDDLQRRRTGAETDLRTALDTWLGRTIEAGAAHEDEVRALEGCLDTLPPTSSRMIRSFYFQGRSAAEVGIETGKSEGAVWVTLMRIRQALRKCIGLRLQGAV